MGFFAWLGSLVDELIEWLGEVWSNFVQALVNKIQAIWYTEIAPVLREAFGILSHITLYVIYYAGAKIDEIIKEVWDPRYPQKQSQVFILKKAPQNTPLPKYRSDAKVLELKPGSG
ncbi:hypothetical protein ACLB6K_13595 [Microcystis aeruginosa FACHB-524]|uniref:hypothetical protein n=1 Tax=Microcystis aeruginosa TaxID=1126 RepID=UPI000F4505E9|nr:hypothetical protein [Microcystis aeruginosa]ROI10199.1 hypothetical protein ED562_05325 [Microcystis aeruginosa FACHB-524]